MASTHSYDDVLDAIRELRRVLSTMTDEELATAVGISRRTLIRYMQPSGDPPYSVVMMLSRVLGIEVTAVVTREYQRSAAA